MPYQDLHPSDAMSTAMAHPDDVPEPKADNSERTLLLTLGVSALAAVLLGLVVSFA